MIRRVAVLGAGALGAVYAKIFHQAGITTTLVAKGERFERIQRDGIYINDTRYRLPVLNAADADDNFTADLVIVATKYHQLASALPDLANVVGRNTLFVSLLNGLTSEDIIGEMYGRENVLLSIAMNLDARREENRIYHTRPPLLVFGEVNNLKTSSKVQAVQEILDEVGISYQTPEDMNRTMWWKFMINVGMNQSSAVTGATFGRYKSEQELRWLKETLMREVIAVAKAEGVDLRDEDATSFYETLDIIAEDGKTSMLQDIEASRKTEVEMFAPVVIELGKKHGIPTPVNQTVFSVIRTLEEQFKH
ncbi:2-dehydropantoate 2-reductase [Granulosicoccus sp.]|jgi:2-dehydropantoate 2-reductase|nr:2-dehydropantoate 2-reductase [Granulosicoccus sp.]MDB4223780.1 2-dehydropantoate 2-reductase [Granulosicoccus sp.]